ncbi:uncharacterized protein [Aegilops tauschii subsp. strangulata]|uniref:uncharacterized protein isoform X3 n=1 Tax=Aegilops tauschii subsp. strangulata TaxID=200361 RepID=UPI003CC88897
MKLAYGLVFLGFLQSVAYQMFDQQVQALFEVKMVLNDSRGVLEDWNRYIDTACSTIATVMCDPDGNVVEIHYSVVNFAMLGEKTSRNPTSSSFYKLRNEKLSQ